MQDLSLHILDIVQNSVRAGASLIEILIVEDEENDSLLLQIKDNGKGMDEQIKRNAANPFFTTKEGKRFGLGLALLSQAAGEAEGSFEVDSDPGKGTIIKASFRHSHPDRKPLGNITETLETLVMGNQGIDFVFKYKQGDEITIFDTRNVQGG